MTEIYKRAFKETLHYLKGIDNYELNKIPIKFMKFLNDNAAENYNCVFNYNKPIDDLNLLEETYGIISIIAYNFWCESNEEKYELLEHLEQNEKKYLKEIEEKYNYENIFKNNKKETREKIESKSLVEYKESIFKKIIKKLINFFK